MLITKFNIIKLLLFILIIINNNNNVESIETRKRQIYDLQNNPIFHKIFNGNNNNDGIITRHFLNYDERKILNNNNNNNKEEVFNNYYYDENLNNYKNKDGIEDKIPQFYYKGIFHSPKDELKIVNLSEIISSTPAITQENFKEILEKLRKSEENSSNKQLFHEINNYEFKLLPLYANYQKFNNNIRKYGENLSNNDMILLLPPLSSRYFRFQANPETKYDNQIGIKDKFGNIFKVNDLLIPQKLENRFKITNPKYDFDTRIFDDKKQLPESNYKLFFDEITTNNPVTNHHGYHLHKFGYPNHSDGANKGNNPITSATSTFPFLRNKTKENGSRNKGKIIFDDIHFKFEFLPEDNQEKRINQTLSKESSQAQSPDLHNFKSLPNYEIGSFRTNSAKNQSATPNNSKDNFESKSFNQLEVGNTLLTNNFKLLPNYDVSNFQAITSSTSKPAVYNLNNSKTLESFKQKTDFRFKLVPNHRTENKKIPTNFQSARKGLPTLNPDQGNFRNNKKLKQNNFEIKEDDLQIGIGYDDIFQTNFGLKENVGELPLEKHQIFDENHEKIYDSYGKILKQS